MKESEEFSAPIILLRLLLAFIIVLLLSIGAFFCGLGFAPPPKCSEPLDSCPVDMFYGYYFFSACAGFFSVFLLTRVLKHNRNRILAAKLTYILGAMLAIAICGINWPTDRYSAYTRMQLIYCLGISLVFGMVGVLTSLKKRKL